MIQIIIIIVSVVADQLLKHFLIPVLLGIPDRTIPIIQDVFHLTYVENRGASFGILQNAQVLFIIITSVVLVVGAYFMIRHRKKQSTFLKISLSLVVGGAIGNQRQAFIRGHHIAAGMGIEPVFEDQRIMCVRRSEDHRVTRDIAQPFRQALAHRRHEGFRNHRQVASDDDCTVALVLDAQRIERQGVLGLVGEAGVFLSLDHRRARRREVSYSHTYS